MRYLSNQADSISKDLMSEIEKAQEKIKSSKLFENLESEFFKKIMQYLNINVAIAKTKI